MKKLLITLILGVFTIPIFSQAIEPIPSGQTWLQSRLKINANFQVTSDSIKYVKLATDTNYGFIESLRDSITDHTVKLRLAGVVGDGTKPPWFDGSSDGGQLLKFYGDNGFWTGLQGGAPTANRSYRLPVAALPDAGTTKLINIDEYGNMGFTDSAPGGGDFDTTTIYEKIDSLKLALNDTISLNDIAPLWTDTISTIATKSDIVSIMGQKKEPFYHFNLGNANPTDTGLFQTGVVMGSFFNRSADTLIVTSIMGGIYGDGENDSIQLMVMHAPYYQTYDSTMTAMMEGSPMVLGTDATGKGYREWTDIVHDTIPPNHWVWARVTYAYPEKKPNMASVTLTGYRLTGEYVPLSQNYVTYSEQLDNAIWVMQNTAVTATDTLPDLDGNMTMESLFRTANAGVFSQVLTVVPLTDYVISFDVRRGTMANASIRVRNQIAGVDLTVTGNNYWSQTSTTETVRVTATFSTPANCTSIRFYPIQGTTSIGNMIFGRFQIAEAGKAYVTTTKNAVK